MTTLIRNYKRVFIPVRNSIYQTQRVFCEKNEPPKKESEKILGKANLDDVSAKAGDLLKKVQGTLAVNSFAQQLVIGSVAGWLTGSTAMALGRPLIFTSGIGIIALEVAHYKGYIGTDFDQLRQKAEKSKKASVGAALPFAGQISAFASKHKVFTAGFIGGLLIGLST